MKTITKISISILFFLFLFSFFSCNKNAKNKIKQGIIEYDIIYLENKLGNISTTMLPKTLTLRFKDNMAIYRISGLFGAFSITNIANSRSATNTTLLKLLDNKYCYRGEKNELACCFDELEGMQLEFTDEEKVILGFTAKKAIASFPDQEREPFIIYYTEDIHIRKPNVTNPYKKIDGVLLEFQLNLSQVTMKLKPRAFHKVEVLEEEFEIPEGYQNVSKQRMTQIFEKLLE